MQVLGWGTLTRLCLNLNIQQSIHAGLAAGLGSRVSMQVLHLFMQTGGRSKFRLGFMASGLPHCQMMFKMFRLEECSGCSRRVLNQFLINEVTSETPAVNDLVNVAMQPAVPLISTNNTTMYMLMTVWDE